MHPSKRKGAQAEREAAAIISDLLGVEVVRRYNLGTHEDVGDLILDDAVVQVANWSDVLRAVREKPLDAEIQRERAGVAFASTWVRMRGGIWRVVLTPEQWATYAREAAA